MERAAWIILFIAVLIALQSREPKPRALPPLEAAECVRFGLGKLTEREQTALGSRVGIPILCAQEFVRRKRGLLGSNRRTSPIARGRKLPAR